MKKLILAVLALSCSSAFAGNAYVGATGTSATHKMAVEGVELSASSAGIGIHAGYQATPLFGIEAGYISFGEAETSAAGYAFGTKPSSVYLAGTLSLDLTPEFALVGKVGMARSDTEVFVSYRGDRESTDKSGTSALFGVGARYAFTPNVAAIVEYTHFGKVAKEDGDSVKVSQVAAGVRFSF